MARDQRNGGVTRVREALDDCAARMRHGETLASILNSYREIADELRPMLQALVALRGDAPATPVPPADLSRGRQRMLAAAAVMRAAEEPDRVQDRTVVSALDAAFARIRSGESLQRIVDGLSDQPVIAAEIALLLRTFEFTRSDALPAPSTNGRLAKGKARFLAAAAVAAESGIGEIEHAAPSSSSNGADDAIDIALSRIRAGDSLESVLADQAPTPDRARAMRELLETAVFVRSDAITPPPMNGALVRGRSHLVAAARVAAEAARSGELDATVADALDSALQQVKNGASIADAIACSSNGDAALARSVRELLSAAEAVQADAIAPPVMNGALERGRRSLLAAAVVAYEAEFRERSTESVQDDALDHALQRIRDGASIEDAIAAASADTALDPHELRRMVLAAEALRFDTVPVPARTLDAGRARMLQVAARARDHRAAMERPRTVSDPSGQPSLLYRIAAMIGGGLGGRRPRIAALTMAMLAAFMLGNAALAPVSARALPGDGLYFHKMIQRSAKLMVSAVNPAWHDRVRAEISAETLEEVETLQSLAREAEVRLEGELHTFEEHTADGDAQRHGVLHIVRIGDDGVTETVALAWRQPPTVFVLPEGYESLGDVPPGTALALQIRTGAFDPFAIDVRTRGLDPLSPLDATSTPAAATPEQETPDPETATATSTVPPTPTDAPSATATVPLTPTLAASSTPTTSPTALTSTDEPKGRERQRWDELLGVIEGPEHVDETGTMQVRRRSNPDIDGTAVGDSVLVRVEIGAARASAGGGSGAELWDRLAVGRTVKLRGRYENPERTFFVANRLLYVNDACVTATAIGEIARFTAGAGGELVLTNGTRFNLSGDEVIDGDPRTGVTVSIEYENCAPDPSIVRRITVETPTVMPEYYSGDVVAVIDGRSFEMNDSSRARRFIVRYDPARVAGEAAVIEVGQQIRFEGILVDEVAAVIEVEGTVVVTGFVPTPTPTATATATETPPLPTPEGGTPPTATMTPPPGPTSLPAPSEIPPPSDSQSRELQGRSRR